MLELLVIVSILAIIAAVVLPSMNDDRTLRVRGASSILISDIEYAQTLTISFPDSPVVVRFDEREKPDRYWLAYEDSPDKPIIREDTGEAYLVVLGEGRAKTAAGLVFHLENLDDNTLRFNAHGGLRDFADIPHITIQPKTATKSVSSLRVSIAPSTGQIYESRVEDGDSK